jgi:hypothetical protein
MGKVGGSATPESGGSPSGSSGTAKTSDERRAAIDRKLDDSLGTLDKEIKKEQERTAQERDARAAANAGNTGTADTDSDSASKKDGDLSSSGTADTEGPKDGKEGQDGKDGKDGKANRPGDLKSDKQRKEGEGNNSGGGAQGSGSAAPSIPDGSDDDIVARRLRKAAEQETDPELKEKLWKEYVEYKKNSGK